MTRWRRVRRNEASSAVCSHCHLRLTAPDGKQCQHCLDVQRHGYRMKQERKTSPEGLAGALKDLRRLGHQYGKQRPRPASVELTPAEVDLLAKYGRWPYSAGTLAAAPWT